jgi:hypothetical protein
VEETKLPKELTQMGQNTFLVIKLLSVMQMAYINYHKGNINFCVKQLKDNKLHQNMGMGSFITSQICQQQTNFPFYNFQG